MTDTGIIGLILVVANFIISYRGFKDQDFFDRYKFSVDGILLYKDYKRLITSSFLHVSWMHLIFNMLGLYIFSGLIESSLGSVKFLVIYFVSSAGGDLLSLYIHRNHGDYTSVGASGAICGLIFASLAIFPGMSVGFFPLPFSMPGWLFGLLFVLYSIYGIRSKKDNIGHDAHLGGALIGMAIALLMEPSAFAENYVTILIIIVPAIVFMYLIITKPSILLVDNFYFKTHKDYYSIDHKYNDEKNARQKEIDNILDKISKRGMKSLTESEKQKLKQYSQTIR